MILATPAAEVQRLFGFPELPNLQPRWNVAPTQPVPAVRREEDGRHLVTLRWGLVPFWADDPSIGARLINARGETLAEKPSFREAFRKRRCLVPVDGFYEWKAEGKRKQGYAIRRRDRAPFAFAGLWERWNGPKGGPALAEPVETLTIVTTTANAVLKPLHDRMPVILDETDWDLWLDPAAPLPVLEGLLKPAPDALLEAHPVGPRVNNVRNDDEACAAPLDDAPTDDAPTLF
ncbi:SOS response-associated peptidase [Azospirillum argentinense]